MRIAAPPDVDVIVDLCEVEAITDDRCGALRNIAEDRESSDNDGGAVPAGP
jgi:hypothetical protein